MIVGVLNVQRCNINFYIMFIYYCDNYNIRKLFSNITYLIYQIID